MSIKIRIEETSFEWPLMIEELKKVDPVLSKSPNKPPSYITAKQTAVIDRGKALAQDLNLENAEKVLSLEMYVEWCFDKMKPNYRVAKWYAMLAYLKSKYGRYVFPKRSTGDLRETQYYNMIGLLRATYRGKTENIKLDKSILSLPYAREWICIKSPKNKCSFTKKDWLEILNFTKSKYGFYLKPKNSKDDSIERKLYRQLLEIRATYKKGELKESILNLPKAQEWIKGIKPSDTELWKDMLDFIQSKYGEYVKPNIKSSDRRERKFAANISSWRSGLKNNNFKMPDPEVLKLPMAQEWLYEKAVSKNYLKLKWFEYLDHMQVKYGEYRIPKVSSSDPTEKKFHSFIATLRRRIKKMDSAEKEALLLLPMTKEWLVSKRSEFRIYKRWNDMLKYILKKYGHYQEPKPLPNDSEERRYYFFLYSLRKKLDKGDPLFESLYHLPMAKEWLLDTKTQDR